MPKVIFNDVTKIYEGGVKALNGFNLAVNNNEFLVIVGPSGCGKTTALRCLAGLEKVTSGDILIGDQKINEVLPKDRQIAMVFQSYALYPHMTVYQNMAFGLKMHHVTTQEIHERISKTARLLEIEELLKRKPEELSGGQRQHVAVGRAIIREPGVILFDEPLSSLDERLRVSLRAELSKLHKRLQASFIYVTHDQQEALTIATRIAVMKDGVIHQIDTPYEIYTHPKNQFVAGFIGSPAMNFVAASLIKKGGQYYACFDENCLLIPKKRFKSLDDHNEKRIILGIRPEDFQNPNNPHPGAKLSIIDGSIDLIELMGDESVIYFFSGKQNLSARIRYNPDYQAGKKAKFGIDMAKIHLFDPDSNSDIPQSIT